MKIPATQPDREQLYQDLISQCFASKKDRVARYDILRNWYLYGNEDGNSMCKYNKLFAHVDLLASFLFSGETTTFVTEVPKCDEYDYNFHTSMAKATTPVVNDTWHDTNVDLVFNEALVWSLVFDTTFVKFLPDKKSQYCSYVIEPQSIGVMREDVITLDEQECVAHEYFISESELRRKIATYGPEEQDRILAHLKGKEETEEANILPSGLQTIIVNSTTPETGESTGEVSEKFFSLYNNYRPVVSEKGILAYELWPYDDDLKDYRKVECLEDGTILIDSMKNTYLPGERPFVKVTPNPMYNYFWGRSELSYLIGLQEWINQRITEIRKILGKLVDPPTDGVGYTEAKLSALMMAGGVATTDSPMAKITQHYPKEVSDLFRELRMIEEMFETISGIRALLSGGGETGVRSKGHADLLARLGSTRPKKKASILEDSVEKLAVIILKSLRAHDATHYVTDNGTKFTIKQLTDRAMVKVDSHSSSPIFIEEQMEKAKMLFEAKAIDAEDLIDAVRFQNAEAIKVKLRKRMAAAAAQAQAEQQAEQAKQEGKESSGI